MSSDDTISTHQSAPRATPLAPPALVRERAATVLQVLPTLEMGGGGVERGTCEVAGAIVEAGGRALVASTGGTLEHELRRQGGELIQLPVDSKNPLVMYKNIERLAEIIRREKVEIVHARSRAPAWSALHAARRTGKHFVTTFHGTYGRQGLFKSTYNSVMGRGERVIAISRFIAGHIRQYYGVPADRIRVIHRGVDLARFDPKVVSAQRVVQLANQWRLTEGLPIVMLPGRLTRWKGQTIFIEALAKLGRQDIRAVIVGSDQGRTDYRQELENLIIRHGLAGVIRLVDHCPDMPAAYMLADVVVSASTEPEAFGRVVPEAQALGRPVVATDHGGARE
ncbi:MAG: glycosyltransferase family 4 protein, partial [Rhodospirillales bacterium]